MGFTIPEADRLKKLRLTSLEDLRDQGYDELQTLRASITSEEATADQVEEMNAVVASIELVESEITERTKTASGVTAVDEKLNARKAQDEQAKADAVTASTETATEQAKAEDSGTKDVKETTTAPSVGGETGTVVEATVTAASAVNETTRRSVGVADAAPYTPALEAKAGFADFAILAAAPLGLGNGEAVAARTEMSWETAARAFEAGTQSYQGRRSTGYRGRNQERLAVIERRFPEESILASVDNDASAFAKLENISSKWGRSLAGDTSALVAANGWCAPSEPDYSTCSPITTDGLFSAPETLVRRGGKIHNQGLDFGDFFGDDFVLPIPGYNILTEAQVEADTAKTCVEIPCPAFVDDRLDIAALCLTGSLLQNVGYPEFVRTFMEGAVAAMAHLVNREIVNQIVTGSTAVNLTTVDPWGTDGTFLSNVMMLLDFAATDLRYVYRARRDQVVEAVLPYWLKVGLRADYLRRNATANDDLADEVINAMLARRRVSAQWIYDWQDAFNPNAAADANHAMGQAAVATLFNIPLTTDILMYLPGTWVIGRQDVIRLDMVYDSTNLAQNQVTQLFMEDGFKPMKMCQHSRVYTIPTCSSGSTGVQRAVACTDVTP